MASRTSRHTQGVALASVVLLSATACGSNAMDRQVAAAIAAAKLEDQQRGTRFAAEAIAAPVWLLGGPVAAGDRDFREAARRLAVEPQLWLAPTNGSASSSSTTDDGTFLVTGPRGRTVRVECDGSELGSVDAVGLAASLRAGAVNVAVSEVASEPVDAGSERAATALGSNTPAASGSAAGEAAYANGPCATVRIVAVDQPQDGLEAVDLEIAVLGASDAAQGVALLVARICAFDAIDARPGTLVVAVREEAAGTVGTGGAPVVEVRYPRRSADVAPEALLEVAGETAIDDQHEAACSIAFGCAALLADPRAGDLGRYLLSLDATYQSMGGAAASEGSRSARLEAWHREVRAELRRICLGLERDDAVLDAPVAAPAPPETWSDDAGS
ncbi:hypothetical protein Pla163_26600 [Planctomycetes bacterium Pla163]|uniref:Uncharacterized protein n=1 Tax=Rohdeia mirabilis TaxID=2528008 RepID=A0A518D223_9BACT|nr:hypothetical protein Pla163_26600 [Planctomycetes bacterium Pla163]